MDSQCPFSGREETGRKQKERWRGRQRWAEEVGGVRNGEATEFI